MRGTASREMLSHLCQPVREYWTLPIAWTAKYVLLASVYAREIFGLSLPRPGSCTRLLGQNVEVVCDMYFQVLGSSAYADLCKIVSL